MDAGRYKEPVSQPLPRDAFDNRQRVSSSNTPEAGPRDPQAAKKAEKATPTHPFQGRVVLPELGKNLSDAGDPLACAIKCPVSSFRIVESMLAAAIVRRKLQRPCDMPHPPHPVSAVQR
jgi:hypothetical protein